MNPVLFLKHWMAVMNNIYDGRKITKSAYEEYKNIILSSTSYVMRQPTEGEFKDAGMDEILPF